MFNIITIILVAALALTVIILLIWKNRKDKKRINPDAEHAVEETIMNQERRRDKI